MARSYDRLKKLMIDKKITNTQLRQATKITTNAMAKIWRDEPVSIETLEKICYTLNCNIEDIVEVIPEKQLQHLYYTPLTVRYMGLQLCQNNVVRKKFYSKGCISMSYITTYLKKYFDPVNADINDIEIADIAHALSLLCRANGHFVQFYSVAQHCLNCAKEAKMRGYSKRVQLGCLLHDASEAYLSDVTRPIKAQLPKYLEVEEKLQNAIYARRTEKREANHRPK